MARVRVKVRIPDELYQRLVRYARMRGISLDEAVREAISRLIVQSSFRRRLAGYPAQPVDDSGW